MLKGKYGSNGVVAEKVGVLELATGARSLGNVDHTETAIVLEHSCFDV